MTTPTVTSSIDSQMQNNIMAAGLRDPPPMLATGRYLKWRSRKEAIHLILTGIRDEIYSTVDACKQLRKCGKLSKGYNKPEWSRFVMIVKQQHKLDEVSYHKLFDILKQYQKEVNELCAERLARNTNPLALVATTQANQDPYYQTSKSHKSYAPSPIPSNPTRSHTTTRHKGKGIVKPSTPPSETAFKEDSDPEQAQRDKDMQKNLALIAKYFKKIHKPTKNNLGTSSNSRNKNVDTTPRYKNDNQFGQFGNQRTVNVVGAREYQKRAKDSAYHKEKMLLCKQAEQDVPLQAEQCDWLVDTDEKFDEHELEAHCSYMAKIQEVPTADTCTDSEPLEQVQNDAGYNVFANDLQHSEQSESNDQNDVESDDECVALANLIANLKLDVDENKRIQKQLKKENTTLSQELKECKTILAKTSKTLGESNSIQDSCLVALQNKQTEFEKYKAFNDRIVDYDKLELWNEQASNVFRKEREQYIEIQDLKAQLQDKNIVISELKKLIKNGKGKSVETKFDKPSVVPQPNAQQIPKPLVLGVNHKTNVSRTHHKSNQFKDKVLPNNSQVKPKKTQVEAHPRISSISNKTKSVTACNDSLNSRTSNVNAVCATCGKCLVDSNHFACVMKMLNDVNARIKKPNIVQLIIFIVDSGCTKHMTGNLKLLCNFVEKFLVTVRFGNDQFAPILGYGDLVAFWKSTCFVRDLQGNDLLTVDAHVPLQQELDLLFGPLYDGFFNTGSNPQDKQPTTNSQTTSAPSNPTNVHAEENNNDQAQEEHLPDDEFTNPLSALA
nr:integrase, catalytic region, zinc finger, CCHC-type, peptidase aspartic, catalytic [Tanacetum cinerariifolium]